MTKHKFYKCGGDCDTHCNFCDGGLAYCTVCCGAEGDLPTDCPGRELTTDEGVKIYNSELDYVDGQWVTL